MTSSLAVFLMIAYGLVCGLVLAPALTTPLDATSWLTLLLGAGFGWFTTHAYHRSAKNETQRQYEFQTRQTADQHATQLLFQRTMIETLATISGAQLARDTAGNPTGGFLFTGAISSTTEDVSTQIVGSSRPPTA